MINLKKDSSFIVPLTPLSFSKSNMICVCLSVCQPVYTDRLLYKRLSHPRKIIFSSLKKIIKSYGGGVRVGRLPPPPLPAPLETC